MVTADSIFKQMQTWVENKEPIDPSTWVDASAKLNVLLEAEDAKLFELEYNIATLKASYIEQNDPTTRAKAKVEALPIYKEMRLQKAKITRMEEMIRIAKLQARVTSENIRGYN